MRRTPQQIPCSVALRSGMVTLAGVSSVLVNSSLLVLHENVLRAVIDLGLLWLFVYLLLWVRAGQARFTQTITALYAVQVLLNLLAWLPILMLSHQGAAPPEGVNYPALFILLLFVYSIGIMGHILQQALAVTWLKATAIAFLYAGFNLFLLEQIFPGEPV